MTRPSFEVRTTQDFYCDGIRDDAQYYRPLYNIEQVEVIRGSDALLSGFGGAYGLINRVSKKGKIGEDFTVVDGSIDTFGETTTIGQELQPQRQHGFQSQPVLGELGKSP